VTRYGTSKADRSVGYSLVELLIAVACVSILLTAGVPGIAKLQHEWALWGAAKTLEASMQWGRMHAIASNAPVIFHTDDVLQEFYWADAASGEPFTGTLRRLPRGVRFVATPRRSLRFYAHGNAAPAGTYTLAGETGSYSVVVAPGGRIRTQKD
jgi:type II secretory pathway pseudopilin PulG